MKENVAIKIFLLVLASTFIVGWSTLVEQAKQMEEINKNGTITIYNEDTGDVYFEYYGIVNIKDNGHEINVDVHIPLNGCECDVSDALQ